MSLIKTPNEKYIGWLSLVTGVVINLAGVITIKFGQDYESLLLGLAGYIAYFLGFYIITLSFKQLDIGTAYAVWSGLGSILTLFVGIVFFNEIISLQKMIFFGFVFLGVIGMSLSS